MRFLELESVVANRLVESALFVYQVISDAVNVLFPRLTYTNHICRFIELHILTSDLNSHSTNKTTDTHDIFQILHFLCC